MDSLFEQQRQTHEELERFERALYTLLSTQQGAHESKLQNEHKSAQILDRIAARVTTLEGIYDDQETRNAEINALSSSANQEDLQEFYSRLAKIQEHHNKYPDAAPVSFDVEFASLVEDGEYDDEYEQEDPISLLFSGEEAYGKYLDLYANHTAYCNLKNIGKRPGYLPYLDTLLAAQNSPVHSELPKEARSTKEYETYIKNLHSYLLSFVKRTQPLLDIESQQQAAQELFTTKWEAGEIEGWAESAPKVAAGDAMGIWCSACQKNYSKQTVYDAHLTSKKHIKATAKQASSSEAAPANPNGPPTTQTAVSTTQSTTSLRLRNSAYLTHLATSLLTTLIPTLTETKSNVERRFSLTAREREQELLDADKPSVAPPPSTTEGGAPGEEDDEEERIYNPLKLPMGWDGKPIPYWLYKLHGLGVEYRCEICSDYVYMGRKNFDRHFQEARHAFGMRALGLPNTKHFHEITIIADALTLAEKLKQEGRHEIFEQETMEELEDDEGNVYNRKTYDDLKKQGII